MQYGSRTYHDPLHGAITLSTQDDVEALLIRLIDTPAFQRLRRIRQLGTASFTFHGAEGSRFTHSLGVMQVARRAFDRLQHQYPELSPHRAVVLCAALLHDVGHGPWSHTCEDIFQTQHEAWTLRILQEHEPLRQLLDGFDPGLMQALAAVYQKQYPVPLVHQLITSQLDCDRLDYLMRDSYFTGASYGQLDLDRLLLALDYDPATQQLVIRPKGLAATEHYLVVRYFMYTQVYNHPKNIASAWGLERLFHRARELYQTGLLTTDAVMGQWLGLPQQSMTLADYIAVDDGVLSYHIQQWSTHPEPILSDLCRRFRDRDLFKAQSISQMSPAQQQDCQQRAAHLAEIRGWLPEYYIGVQTSTTRGYTLYQRGIKVRTASALVEISDISPLVQALTQPYHQAWFIYPKALESDLKTMVQ